jgi:hypothetical protein
MTAEPAVTFPLTTVTVYVTTSEGTYTAIAAERLEGESVQGDRQTVAVPYITDEMRAVFWSIFHAEVEQSESYERAKRLYPDIAHLLR